jgi:ABC-type lipoprotein export system ATPase subunit
MTIQLQKLLPLALQDKIRQQGSEVWNTDLSFAEGSLVKITAPSGTGKTTLVHMLYGLRTDYSGHILWNQQPIKNYTNNQLAGLRQTGVSVILQDLRLFPNLTALENIELKRVMQNPVCTSEQVQQMADLLGVKHVLQQKAGTCSYGEQQRIAIIRALVQPFKWLLMDEPFSHLDQQNTALAAQLIAEQCNQQRAGFIITDLDEDAHFSYTHKYNL